MSKTEKMMDVLGKAGMWCSQNKYLNSLKNGFISFMPATIAGAFAILWSNVLVNADTGLGAFFPPIMALEFLNPVFDAVSFATISCISIAIVILVAYEMSITNGETGVFPAVVGLLCWIAVTPYSFSGANLGVTLADNAKVLVSDILPQGAVVDGYRGIVSSYSGSTGLFTAIIVGMVSMEIYNFFRKKDALKIKLPEQVPPGVASSFGALVPTVLTITAMAAIGQVTYSATGYYLNDLISAYIQAPLQNIAGDSIWVGLLFYLLISLFWIVGIHGTAIVPTSLFKPMSLINMAIFTGAATADQMKHGYYTVNTYMLTMFGEFGGSGLTLGLIISIFLFGKREDNRAIASLSIIPGIFNINETVTFGVPIVMNPILSIPFILAPLSITLGYLLIVSGFCPPCVLDVPWTTPPIIYGFLATGANIRGAISQLLALILVTAIYAPFVKIYENFQNKQDACID